MGTSESKPTVDCTAEDYAFVTTTNLESAYNLSQFAHPLLKASGAGNIVFVSSIAGVVSVAGIGSVYAAAKGTVFQLITIYCLKLSHRKFFLRTNDYKKRSCDDL